MKSAVFLLWASHDSQPCCRLSEGTDWTVHSFCSPCRVSKGPSTAVNPRPLIPQAKKWGISPFHAAGHFCKLHQILTHSVHAGLVVFLSPHSYLALRDGSGGGKFVAVLCHKECSCLLIRAKCSPLCVCVCVYGEERNRGCIRTSELY